MYFASMAYDLTPPSNPTDISQITAWFVEINIPRTIVERKEFSPQPSDDLIFRFSCVRKAGCP